MRNRRATLIYSISIALVGSLSLVVVLFLAAVPATAQQPTVKLTPIVYTPPNDGHQMYVTYCAPCHGVAAKGNGPAAPTFKNAPTDLTLLSKKNGGKYPYALVRNTLLFSTNVPAHGNPEMPVWGGAFHSLEPSNSANYPSSELRITNLVNYIKTLQAK